MKKRIVENTRTGQRIIKQTAGGFWVEGDTVMVMVIKRWFGRYEMHLYIKNRNGRWVRSLPAYSVHTKRAALASARKSTK